MGFFVKTQEFPFEARVVLLYLKRAPLAINFERSNNLASGQLVVRETTKRFGGIEFSYSLDAGVLSVRSSEPGMQVSDTGDAIASTDVMLGSTPVSEEVVVRPVSQYESPWGVLFRSPNGESLTIALGPGEYSYAVI